ncbi:Cell division cycle protein 48 [Pyrenophora tritici-repentis]|uniref:Cell division cycle protein n=2 Tax=Pyrenophora tritici-repentis TaxID=45151 RepID=A0A2W1FZG5_9PLEO|nr:cell division cycle protein 48 [Pyrenophora tritici-repentis Pt-1C-BFP]KAF7566637.1 SpoVK, ATPase AAA+ class [Pyrenophora tritici-repentis]EDU51204.1 cell division cycle protein 48 [Pyrenophora tritici-repentis Pt-1C-BFP]KAI0578532.1 Cell division cycle protein 48 [Pyrenophora tritici-repentis]KAI0583628.1 Cell division cycle protein 48 [Pyrenophora tritici-repentis]KAI0610369.1 Cell division cycle protein 48 [Pyrenophora tritici-repentis]
MSPATSYTLRPLERNPPNIPSNALDSGAFRVQLSQKELKSLGLTIGDCVRLSTETAFKGYGVAWLAPQTNPGNKPIARVSDLLREHYELSLNDAVFIEKVDSWKPLKSIEVSFSDIANQTVKFASTEQLLYWLRYSLAGDSDIILPGCSFPVQQKSFKQKGQKLRVTVQSIDPLPSEKYAVYFDEVTTQITTIGHVATQEPTETASGVFRLKSDGIGGLSEHITTINQELAFLSDSLPHLRNRHLLGTAAFLLHGPEGTGKSLLLDRLADCPWQEVYRINPVTHPKGQAKAISDIFNDARENQPSLIIMDNLDRLLDKAESLVNTLRIELATLEGAQVVVAAAARSIYDVDSSLRTAAAFMIELELLPPNAKQREDIVRQVLGPTCNTADVDFTALAERSHGFVGRDIASLCRFARRRRVMRSKNPIQDGKSARVNEVDEQTEFIEQADFDAVMECVRPTVLKDSILEVPKVRWTDIAGLDHVRAVLEAITIRPFKYPDLDVKFGGPQSRKGVLLYGPPGCAKTLIAQAVATESKQNFLAVKGSELIKMYVGESERAIRDVFRRARAAKPCIIFFDEIDSIGKSREKTQDSGLNVVTTLLNEMDGIEALKDVFIIGATNRPDILDSALIRTGRFDAHMHIGLPTEEARKQILQIHTRKRPLAPDVDLDAVAKKTEGSSGADISGLCAVAVELAITDYTAEPNNEPQVHMRHFEQALQQHVPHTIAAEAKRYQNWRPGKSLSEA